MWLACSTPYKSKFIIFGFSGRLLSIQEKASSNVFKGFLLDKTSCYTHRHNVGEKGSSRIDEILTFAFGLLLFSQRTNTQEDGVYHQPIKFKI